VPAGLADEKVNGGLQGDKFRDLRKLFLPGYFGQAGNSCIKKLNGVFGSFV
jgi:hypothetical protein